MATNSIKLLTGNSHPQLAKLVADRYVLALLGSGYQELQWGGGGRKGEMSEEGNPEGEGDKWLTLFIDWALSSQRP